MKNNKISFVIATLFSIFLIIYFNPLSIAQESTIEELKIESDVYKQLEESEKITIIVKLSDDSTSEDISKIVKKSKENIQKLSKEIESKKGKLEIIQNYESFNSLAISVDKETLEILKQSNLVQEIFAERMLEIQHQQSMPLINATQAWNYPITNTTNLTGSGSTVCLIDTGVDYNHIALGGAYGVKVIGGYDFVNNDTNPVDDNGHGTHLAGIIAGNGIVNQNPTTQILFRGVAPDAVIVAEKVCTSTGSCSNTNMLAGINHCLTTISPKKLSVISVSIGDGGSYSNISGTCPTWMDTAINTAVGKGIPVVVSSGNQAHKNGISYPACSPNATSVGMTYDHNSSPFNLNMTICLETAGVDKVSCASNTGNNLDLVAPGALISSLSTQLGSLGSCGYNPTTLSNGLTTCKGTSQSAAHVSGAVALIKQKYRSNLKPNYIGVLRIEKILRGSPVLTTDLANGLTFPRLSLQYLI